MISLLAPDIIYGLAYLPLHRDIAMPHSISKDVSKG